MHEYAGTEQDYSGEAKKVKVAMEGRKPVDHYMAGRWEVIDVIEGMMPPGLTPYQGMLWGNSVKYIMRFMLKRKPVDDLYKAETYLRWLRDDIKKTLDKA
jgi:hypothetical protein